MDRRFLRDIIMLDNSLTYLGSLIESSKFKNYKYYTENSETVMFVLRDVRPKISWRESSEFSV